MSEALTESEASALAELISAARFAADGPHTLRAVARRLGCRPRDVARIEARALRKLAAVARRIDSRARCML